MLIRKSQPTPSDVHVDAVLTNISVAYIQQQSHFIAGKVFPIVPVEKQTDKYFIYTKADWFRDEAKRRAPSTESAGSGYGLSTATYSCDVYAMHKDVPDQVRQNSDAPINPDRDATQFVTQRLMLRLEKQWAADYFTTSVWDTDATPTNLWDNYATSDPITDIENAKRAILVTTGFMPNTLVLGYDVMKALKHHPDLIDRFKYTSAVGSITEDMLAKVFGVDRILVAMAINNTAVEGETASFSFVHGKHALLCYVAPTPSLLAPSAGYMFSWRGISRGLGQDIGVKRFRMEQLEADRVEGQIAFDDKVVATDLGYFFNGAVS
jgi:hypothetical protein